MGFAADLYAGDLVVDIGFFCGATTSAVTAFIKHVDDQDRRGIRLRANRVYRR